MSQQVALQKAFELIDKEQYLECIDHIDRALEFFLNDPDLLSIRGEAKFKLKRYKAALKDYDKAQELEPKNAYRFASRAFVKDAMGDTKGAVEDYKVALQLDPTDATILNNLGVLEEKLGYKEASQRKFKLADELYKLDQNNAAPSIEEAQPEIEERQSMLRILRLLLVSKKQRLEFLKFLKNGFKLK